MKRFVALFALIATLLALSAQSAAAVCQAQPVVMYVSPGCGWCQIARVEFSQRGVQWIERDATANGFRATPVFWIDGTWIIGYNRALLGQNLCTIF